MSLLGSQVYANPDTPIWLSAGGGAGGGTDITLLNIIDTSGNVAGSYRAGTTGNVPVASAIQGNRIAFSRTGLVPDINISPAANFATFLDVSSGGALNGGADYFRIGGWVAPTRIVNVGGVNSVSFAGRGIISSNTGISTISNNYITSNSYLMLSAVETATTPTYGVLTYSTLDISSNSFVVKLVDPTTGTSYVPIQDVQYNWFVVNNQNDLPYPFF
jgi:hypothetical protein